MNQRIIPPQRPSFEPVTVLIDAHPFAKFITLDPRAYKLTKGEIAQELAGVVRRWIEENAD
jgi:hypothetical protein